MSNDKSKLHFYSYIVVCLIVIVVSSLGAVHDGEGAAKDCPSEDYFIMTSYERTFQPEEPYTRNPWLFSNCSVQSFMALLSS
ncbi:hypothetical protein CHS0354_034399, partial [Potamilus streckersoni]